VPLAASSQRAVPVHDDGRMGEGGGEAARPAKTHVQIFDDAEENQKHNEYWLVNFAIPGVIPKSGAIS
jgi:hypothetical protein